MWYVQAVAIIHKKAIVRSIIAVSRVSSLLNCIRKTLKRQQKQERQTLPFAINYVELVTIIDVECCAVLQLLLY